MLSTMAVVALSVDLAWYELGRRHGARVLVGLCRLSVEPDLCVRRAQNVFGRYGARAMILAKFLPGVTTVLPPLAGIFAVGRIRFALYEIAGVLLWAGTWIGVGYVFSDAVTVIAVRVGALGVRLAVGGSHDLVMEPVPVARGCVGEGRIPDLEPVLLAPPPRRAQRQRPISLHMRT